MAITSFNSDSRYLSRTLSKTRASVLPGTIASMFLRSPTVINGGAFSIGIGAAQGLDFRLETAATNFWAVNRSTPGYVFSQNDPAGGVVAGTWYHLICLFGSSVADQSPLYINGVQTAAAALNAAFDTAGTFDHLYVGRQTAVSLPYGGDYAEFALWWSSAGLPGIATLANNLGVLLQSPLQQAVAPDLYYPFINNRVADLGREQLPLTLVGGVEPTFTTHPAVAQVAHPSAAFMCA